MTLAGLLALVFVPMLIEARRAARHEREQLSRGGIEPAGDVYQVMRLAYPGAFLAMLVEGAIRGLPGAPVAAIGLVVFALAKFLKWWAILSLGPSWTFRVIVRPGSTRVTDGPYRFADHPNYVGVIGELLGVGLMTGAVITGPLGVAGFGGLIVRRIAVERRALDAILPRA
ncbi:MAG: isoprenylcysteine carboxylmethyltransferase family protein [Vicinamibacterales bacterium]